MTPRIHVCLLPILQARNTFAMHIWLQRNPIPNRTSLERQNEIWKAVNVLMSYRVRPELCMAKELTKAEVLMKFSKSSNGPGTTRGHEGVCAHGRKNLDKWRTTVGIDIQYIYLYIGEQSQNLLSKFRNYKLGEGRIRSQSWNQCLWL